VIPAEIPRARTLGELLDEAGRRLAARHLPVYPWAGGLRRLLERAASLATQQQGRFERVEWPPGGRDALAFAERLAGARGPAVPALDGPVPVGPSPPAAGGDTGRPLPADVRWRLRDLAGPGADALRVHDDGPADALARARGADAVTVGHHVYFREGRYRPRQEQGFALLAHEATHVLALLRPWSAWRRGTDAEAVEEERDARAAERAAGHGRGPGDGQGARVRAGAGAGPGPPATTFPAAGATPPAAAARPMAAPADRDQDTPAAPPLPDLEGLRRQLIDDLRRQLRDEFERGG
jgi:hypothetical protein